MATKTIVCPECQAPATPGRYSCVRCGALLASIAMTPRAYEGRGPVQPMAELLPAADRPDHAVRGPLEPSPVAPLAVHAPDPIAPAWTQSLAAEQVDSEASPDERWDDELATADLAATTSAALAKRPDEPAEIGAPSGLPLPESRGVTASRLRRARPSRAKASTAPVAVAPAVTVAPAPQPTRKPTARPRRPVDPTAIDRIAPLAQLTAEIERSAAHRAGGPEDAVAMGGDPSAGVVSPAPPLPVPTAAADPVVVEPIESDVLEPAHDAPPIPGWPPPGDLPMAPEPLARVPAGAYLPPSAVLPPGEALPIATEATGRAKAHDRRGSDSVGRPSATDRLSELGLPADTSRLVVSIGAAVAALAFLLPWTAAPAGDDVLADYVARWGLAGPGHWIVAAFLVALAAVAGMSGTGPESSPAGPDPRSDVAPGVARRADAPTSARLLGVGLPSIGLASLLLGLAWPYLFGFLGRAVGLWVVLAGLLLLVAGGLLDLRTGRHRSPTPSV